MGIKCLIETVAHNKHYSAKANLQLWLLGSLNSLKEGKDHLDNFIVL